MTDEQRETSRRLRFKYEAFPDLGVHAAFTRRWFPNDDMGGVTHTMPVNVIAHDDSPVGVYAGPYGDNVVLVSSLRLAYIVDEILMGMRQ